MKSSLFFLFLVLLCKGTTTAEAYGDRTASYVHRGPYLERCSNLPDLKRLFESTDTTAEKHHVQPGNKNPTNAFIIVKASKKRCYVGEPLTVTYKLYSRLHSKINITKQPSFSGFISRDLQDNIALIEPDEKINGLSYEVHTLRKMQLVPIQTDTLELDYMELQASVRSIKDLPVQNMHTGLNSLVEHMLKQENAALKKVVISSKPTQLFVAELPEENRPAGFNNAVGNFGIKAIISPGKITCNKLTSIKIEVTGNGFLPLVTAPSIAWPVTIDAFDIRSTELPDKDVEGVQGRKTFEYQFMPTKSGQYTLPPIAFSFFDPTGKQYKTIYTQRISFKVTDSERNLDRAPKLLSPPQQENNLWLVAATVLVALLIFWLLKSYRVDVTKSTKLPLKSLPVLPAGTEQNAEPSCETESTDPVQELRQLLLVSRYDDFYRELNAMLWQTLARQLGLSQIELNNNKVTECLIQSGWDQEMLENVIFVMAICERTVYIRGYQAEIEPGDLLKRAESVLVHLNKLDASLIGKTESQLLNVHL